MLKIHMMWQEISYWGKMLAKNGLVTSRFGNISVRTDNGLIIKRTGVMLEDIRGPEDVIEVGLQPGPDDRYASVETSSHRAIYLATDAKAIIHAHPNFAIVESLLCKDEVKPLDSEGIPFLGTIPIVDGESGSKELYDNLTAVLKDKKTKGLINRGHGSFALGPHLMDCYNTTTMIEHSSRIRYYYDLAARGQ